MDTRIVKAAIYPAIGIARVGNSEEEYYIGPEVTAPQYHPASYYKDATGAFKRQAARFRIYGLNAAGIPVKELTLDDAEIVWHVEIANKKSAWYEFETAMDIPQAVPVKRRNANITDRDSLKITPSPKSISGPGVCGGDFAFDDGTFMDNNVYLGELRTDPQGRLLFLGGFGISDSPWPNNPPTTFANNDGWHDDVSDGPVDASVIYDGDELQVEGAWIVTAPPNYAPDLVGIQTMYDVIFNTLDAPSTGSAGLYAKRKVTPSFQHDILPILQQFSQMQWVNKGFYNSFGFKQNYDFYDESLLYKLSTITTAPNGTVDDEFQEARRIIFHYFRNPDGKSVDPRLWPWYYGDDVGGTSHNAYFSLTGTLYYYFEQWMKGNFTQDYDPNYQEPTELDQIQSPLAQTEMLTKSALHFCLGGPFHPGCEITWPMRMAGMYTAPFRIRRRSANNPEPPYDDKDHLYLDPAPFQAGASSVTPIDENWNAPGDLTRWMAVPWQTDTSSCRSGYSSDYDPYIPTFWPATVPNNVLSEKDYQIVMNESLPRGERLRAFNRRVTWFRTLGKFYLDQIDNMTKIYGDLGVIAFKPGIEDDPDFPPMMYVESVPFAPGGDQEDASVRDRLAAAIEKMEEIPDFQGETDGSVGRGRVMRIHKNVF